MTFWNKLRAKVGLGSTGEYESDELLLYMDNDQKLYRQMQAIRLNLIKHFCRGNFNSTQAEKGFAHATDEANRQYKKEFSYQGFPPVERAKVNKELVKRLKRDVNYCLEGFQCNDLTKDEESLLKSKKCKVSTPMAGLRGTKKTKGKRR